LMGLAVMHSRTNMSGFLWVSFADYYT
jgi:hypothetical protein